MIMYVSESGVTAQNLEENLPAILQRLIDTLGADAGAVLVKESDRVIVKASVGYDEAAIAKLSTPAGRGFSGTVTASGEPLYVEDLQTDNRVISPILKEMGFKSVIGIPIKDRLEIIGVLHVGWKDVHPYKKQDIDVMNIIADRCSAALVNAMLYKKNKKLQLQSQYKSVKGF
jgi:GAF domain-containing protein